MGWIQVHQQKMDWHWLDSYGTMQNVGLTMAEEKMKCMGYRVLNLEPGVATLTSGSPWAIC